MSKKQGQYQNLPKGNPVMALRLSPEEKEIWMEAAARDGHTRLGTWIKWLVRSRVEWQRDNDEQTK